VVKPASAAPSTTLQAAAGGKYAGQHQRGAGGRCSWLVLWVAAHLQLLCARHSIAGRSRVSAHQPATSTQFTAPPRHHARASLPPVVRPQAHAQDAAGDNREAILGKARQPLHPPNRHDGDLQIKGVSRTDRFGEDEQC